MKSFASIAFKGQFKPIYRMNYHGKEEKIEAGEYVCHVTDHGEIIRAYVERVDGEILELAFSDSEFGCELISTCYRDENQSH